MKKLDYLEGLRGLAAFTVVLSHFIVAFYPALYNGDINQIHTEKGLELIIAKNPINIFYNGNLAVCIFFILSGYVLSYKYFKSRDIDVIISGAIRRYFRLLIPVLFSIILVYLFMRLSLFFNKQAGDISYSTWWLSTFWNFETSVVDILKNSFYEVFFMYDYKYNTVLWTMSYEFYGSMLVFSTIFVLRQAKYRYLGYFILVLIFYQTYYLAFILGLILSDILNSDNKYVKMEINSIKAKVTIILFLLLGLYFGSFPSGLQAENTIYEILPLHFKDPVMFYHIIGAFMLIVVVLMSKSLQILLSKKLCVVLGKISFSMYLIHVIIIGSLSSYLFINLVTVLPYSLTFIIVFFGSMPVILISSYFMYKYIDMKGVEFSTFIYRYIYKKTLNRKNPKKTA